MNFEVKELKNNDQGAIDLIVNNHYLKRKPPIKHLFGLFENNLLVGVITYSLPCRALTQKFNNKILELTRLFILDDTPKNSESYFISRTIKMLKEKNEYDLLVSYAQIDANHVGIVYQATNWLWCGFSQKSKDPIIKGYEGQHPRNIFSKFKTMKKLREVIGEDLVYSFPRSRKVRYFYILNPYKKIKKELLSTLKKEYELQSGKPNTKNSFFKEIYEQDMINKKILKENKIKNKIWKEIIEQKLIKEKNE